MKYNVNESKIILLAITANGKLLALSKIEDNKIILQPPMITIHPSKDPKEDLKNLAKQVTKGIVDDIDFYRLYSETVGVNGVKHTTYLCRIKEEVEESRFNSDGVMVTPIDPKYLFNPDHLSLRFLNFQTY